jgi:hypothetical protein
MREGSTVALTKVNDSPVVDCIEVISSGGSYVLYTFDRRLSTFDGTSMQELTYSSSLNILTDTTTIRRLETYNGYGYVVDGTDKLYKVDGTTVSQLSIPESSIYGNAIEVFTMFGSLAVLTDGGYMRYTAVGSDTVWEERVVIPGTVSASGTTITGTDTFFTNLSIGHKLILTDGVNTEVVTISQIVSNTQITTTATLSNTFSAGTDIIFKGLDFQQPIDIGDGLIPRMGTQFGNSLAITKVSPDLDSSKSKLIVLSPLNIDPVSSAMLFKQQNASDAFAIHPYSLENYEDKLLFMTDTGLYLLQPAQSDIETIRPMLISRDKLEFKLRNIRESRRGNTRISYIATGDINSIFISTTVDADSEFNNIMLVGIYDQTVEGFEFTELRIPTFGDQDSSINDQFSHNQMIRLGDKIYMFGKQAIHEVFEDSNKLDEVPYATIPGTLWDSSVKMSSSSVLSSMVNPALITLNRPINRELKTGALSNDLFNTQTLYKFYLVVAESKSNLTPTSDSYSISFVLDNKTTGFAVDRVYAPGQVSNLITFDNVTVKFDSGVVTFDVDEAESSQQAPLEYFSKTKNWTTAALRIEDSTSSGTLELRGYGFTLKTSRYS